MISKITTDEIWKDVVNYEGLYEVSSIGRIRSVPRVAKRPHKSKPHVMTLQGVVRQMSVHMSSGYYRIPLSKKGQVTYHYVHNLVAMAFLGQRPNRHDVDHINHNRQDNRVENLRYLSYKLNRGMPGNKHAKK